DDPLLADFAPTRHLGWVVPVGRKAVDQAAWTVGVVVFLVDGERVPIRIGHRVEMVQVPEEAIEAVHGRKKLVEITAMALAELAGGIAQGFEHGGECYRLVRYADIGASVPYGRQPRADR